MDLNQEVLKQMIKACDPDGLRALLNELGYPLQPITPALLERVHREEGDDFAIAFAELINDTIASRKLDRLTGDEFDNWLFGTGDWAPDTTSTQSGGFDYLETIRVAGDFLGKVLPMLNINGAANANAMTQAAITERERIIAEQKAQSNPWPWVIGGLVVVGLIVAIVTTKK